MIIKNCRRGGCPRHGLIVDLMVVEDSCAFIMVFVFVKAKAKKENHKHGDNHLLQIFIRAPNDTQVATFMRELNVKHSNY